MKTFIITTTKMRKFKIKSENREQVDLLARSLLEDMEEILMIECKD